MARAIGGTDWREGAAYAPLLAADPSLLAWEWLRRDPAYRAAAARRGLSPATAADWGLHAFEDPELGVPHARPIWRAAAHPAVLAAVAGPAEAPEDMVRLEALGELVTVSGRHVLISDGRRTIRLDIAGQTPLADPLMLQYRLAGVASARAPLLTLRRLLALLARGAFSRALHALEPAARRRVLALRAYDGLRAGADQRMIAVHLLGAAAGQARWRVKAPSLRSQAQRLVKSARLLAAGGYRRYLA